MKHETTPQRAEVERLGRRLLALLGENPGNVPLQLPNGEVVVDGCFSAAEITAALEKALGAEATATDEALP